MIGVITRTEGHRQIVALTVKPQKGRSKVFWVDRSHFDQIFKGETPAKGRKIEVVEARGTVVATIKVNR